MTIGVSRSPQIYSGISKLGSTGFGVLGAAHLATARSPQDWQNRCLDTARKNKSKRSAL